MKKTIIATWGVANQGKSESIKNTCRIILENFNVTELSIPIEQIDYSKDILLTIKIGQIKIGFESQGDPNSRMIWEDSIKKLADTNFDKDLGGCHIIICATRSSGATHDKVYEIADLYGYDVLWKTTYASHTLNQTTLNRMSAQDTISLIKSLISCEL